MSDIKVDVIGKKIKEINRGKFTEGQYTQLEKLFYELAQLGGDMFYYLHFSHDHADTYWAVMGDDTRIYVDAICIAPDKFRLTNISILSHSGHHGEARSQAAVERRLGFTLNRLVVALSHLSFIESVGEIKVQ